MEAQKCGHHNHVAANTHKITYFIDEQEPFIEMPEKEKYNIMRKLISVYSRVGAIP